MMEYKGYVAAVEFDDSADILHGRVVNSGAYPMRPSRQRMPGRSAGSSNAPSTST